MQRPAATCWDPPGRTACAASRRCCVRGALCRTPSTTAASAGARRCLLLPEAYDVIVAVVFRVRRVLLPCSCLLLSSSPAWCSPWYLLVEALLLVVWLMLFRFYGPGGPTNDSNPFFVRCRNGVLSPIYKTNGATSDWHALVASWLSSLSLRFAACSRVLQAPALASTLRARLPATPMTTRAAPSRTR